VLRVATWRRGGVASSRGRSSVVDFTLSDDQLALRDLAHDFAVGQIRPVAWSYDRDATFPQEIIEQAWALGLMNVYIPERYGGAGVSCLDGVVIEEELAWGCAGIQSSVGANGLATTPLLLAGSEGLKRQYLEKLTQAPLLAAFCLTEPDAGSDVAALSMHAVRAKSTYRITGSKSFVTNGGVADFFTVFAKTDPDAGHRGISAFIVPRDAGVVVGKHEDKMGQRASNTATVTFPDVEVPLDHLIGAENDGFKIAMTTLDHTRPRIAAMATGIARAAFEFAVEYAKERRQFGVPISTHQAIQFMIADMATEIEAARLLTWKSAALLDEGRRNTLVSSHAKRFAADVAMKVTTDAVQIFGGYGYIKDYPVEKLMRDAKLMQIYEGTSQIQRLVIAREVFDVGP
jgi:acyl-CoA dehydrogenase